jgi:hypothetical protein
MLKIKKMNFLFLLWWLLLPALLACRPPGEIGIREQNAVTSVVKRDDRTEKRCMAVWFQKAVEGYGKEYLDAEYQLGHGGAAAIDTLQQNRNHPDPIARLMVECLLAWMQGTAPETAVLLGVQRLRLLRHILNWVHL